MATLIESHQGKLQQSNPTVVTQSYSIQQYYSGISVFVTGGTGFIGKLIVEKLLRTCSDLKRMYILIRPKKDKTVEQRFEEFLDSVLLERLKLEHPTFKEKITLIYGDCALPDLGLNNYDKQTLIDEVNCIFHCAATVRFDEKVRTAAYTNVRATRDILAISKQMKDLKSLVYVSTAYSNCVRNEIDEELHEYAITGKNLLALVDNLDDDLLMKIKPTLIGSWPNTYAFSKAMAEEVVKTEGKGLPIAVVRPSIALPESSMERTPIELKKARVGKDSSTDDKTLIGTSKEPVAGWIDNVYGPTGIFVGAFLGLLRILNCKKDLLVDIVPADFVVNCSIAAAWNASLTKNLQTIKDTHNEINNNSCIETKNDSILVYNYVSSVQKPISWRDTMHLVKKHIVGIPSALIIWYPIFFYIPNYYVHTFCAVLLHTIPAYIADFVAYCIGKQPMLIKSYKKINKFTTVLSYFTNREWRFQNDNTQALWKNLQPHDQQRFDFNMDSLNWDSYFFTYTRGARIYLLKDPLDTVPQGRAKYIKFKIAHYMLVGLLVLALYKFIIFFWNVIF